MKNVGSDEGVKDGCAGSAGSLWIVSLVMEKSGRSTNSGNGYVFDNRGHFMGQFDDMCVPRRLAYDCKFPRSVTSLHIET